MTVRLNRLSPSGGVSGLRDLPDTKRTEGSGFAEALDRMDATIRDAEQLAADQAAGKNVEVHELVLSQQQALLAMQNAVAIRNTAINAYRELMRATEGG